MRVFLFICAFASADVYMHNPRGSNDRNCERNVNRNNGNLLFDSQNNAKGGYACGRKVAGNNANDQTPQMEYWEGSKLPIKWTAQHGTGALDTSKQGKAENTVDAEIVIQYACENTLDPTMKYRSPSGLVGSPRDGIPNNNNDAATNRANTQDQKGANNADSYQTDTPNQYTVHETAEFYNECNRVSRNKDLFTADQNVNRRSAIGTRQNPNGGRRGLECPEERDYYPYWRPTPWQDAALLVTDGKRCGDFMKAASDPQASAMNIGDWCQPGREGANACAASGLPNTVAESQSVSGRSYCKLNYENVNGAQLLRPPTEATTVATAGKTAQQNYQAARRLYNRREWPMTAAACTEVGQAWVTGTDVKFSSRVAKMTDGLDAKTDGPLCRVGEFSRPNHLGNGQAPYRSEADVTANVLGDVEGGYAAATNTFAFEIPTFSQATHDTYDAVGVNQAKALACVIRLRYNMSTTDFPRDTINAKLNQGGDTTSPIQQDPYVEIGNDGAIGTVKAGGNPTQLLALNMNTNQLARTFQDRSYVFKVRAMTAAQKLEVAANCEPGVAGKAEVWNVNVQGKRGNIVQTYPSVEYNWVPQSICAPQKACLHIQATGSDYNPRRGCNDGAGGPPDPDNGGQSNQNARADRSNLVEQANFAESYPMVKEGDANSIAQLGYGKATAGVKKGDGNTRPFFSDAATAYRMAFLDQEAQLAGKQIDARADDMWTGATYHYARNSARQGCLSETQINNLQNGNRRETHPRNCAFLNAARTPYQNQGLVKITPDHPEGEKYALYSSRNNNFSNREQQLAIQVGKMTNGQLSCAKENSVATTPAVIPGIINLAPAVDPAEYEATIARMAELDVDGDDPVENDGQGDGIKVGCTALMMNAASYSGISFISVLLVFSTILLR